jgi:DNA modification methylase/ribosomal protein S19E (S16A)
MAKQSSFDDYKVRKEVLEVVKKYGKLPEDFRFDPNIFDLNKALGVDKTAKLLYDGKKDKRTIIDKTISAPFQEIRKFGISKEKSEIKSEKNWYNKLIYGDNLQALKYLLDNGYKEKIKLIYIDPPFATKSDFSKGEVKAYRDKLEGAEFIEFLRERLILLKELLHKEGSIFVHLDDKKSHYIRVVLDEIFTEANFRNEIIWHFDYGARPKTEYGHKHNNIFWYSKNLDSYKFIMKQVLVPYESGMTKWRYTKGGQKGKPMPKGKIPSDVWNIKVNAMSKEHEIEYPTRKPEELLRKIINTVCDNPNDIVLDAFAGSSTTCLVAEELNHKWIGIDAGKLAIYTSQKRFLDIKNYKPFIVMNSGVYEIKDIDKQVKIDENLYKDFACDLFQVDRNKKETINGVDFSGKYGNNYVYVFRNKGKIFRQDLKKLEDKLEGKLKRVYIIISQNQDKVYTNYLKINNAEFYIHKIPYSLIVQFAIENKDSSLIINHLRKNYILKANRGNLKNTDDENAPEIDKKALEKINKISQVKKKSDIETKFSNIAGFDFVNTFEIEISEKIKEKKDGVEIGINKVKIGDKEGINNLSMILVDKNYNGKSFKVSDTFFAEDDIEEDEEGNKKEIKGFVKTKKINIDKKGLGKEIGVIYLDNFGNELFKEFSLK